MAFFFIAIACITILYLILIFSFNLGWIRIKTYRKGQVDPSSLYISLIIAAKNEETNILKLINSLSNQSLSKSAYEIILVNDHSSDNTLQVATSFSQEIPNLKVLTLPNNKRGKKQALKFGVQTSKGELIVTTDADCTHSKFWLETLASFHLKFKPKLIIAPVLMQSSNPFEKMQALDFFSLMTSGAGASGIKKSIMCNGANLAFEKNSYLEFDDPFNDKYRSGDDIFLLLNIKRHYRDKILFLKSTEAIAFTPPAKTFKELLNQRIRWTSKSGGYKDSEIITTSLLVLLINFSLLFNLFFAIFSIEFRLVFFIQFITKSAIDFVFLSNTSHYFRLKKLLWYFIPTQLANIIIIPYLAMVGIGSSVKWKV